jgi:hypothetical protein
MLTLRGSARMDNVFTHVVCEGEMTFLLGLVAVVAAYDRMLGSSTDPQLADLATELNIIRALSLGLGRQKLRGDKEISCAERLLTCYQQRLSNFDFKEPSGRACYRHAWIKLNQGAWLSVLKFAGSLGGDDIKKIVEQVHWRNNCRLQELVLSLSNVERHTLANQKILIGQALQAQCDKWHQETLRHALELRRLLVPTKLCPSCNIL